MLLRCTHALRRKSSYFKCAECTAVVMHWVKEEEMGFVQTVAGNCRAGKTTHYKWLLTISFIWILYITEICDYKVHHPKWILTRTYHKVNNPHIFKITCIWVSARRSNSCPQVLGVKIPEIWGYWCTLDLLSTVPSLKHLPLLCISHPTNLCGVQGQGSLSGAGFPFHAHNKGQSSFDSDRILYKHTHRHQKMLLLG